METITPYAARLEIDRPGPMQRLSTFLRIAYVIPIGLILAFLVGGGTAPGNSSSSSEQDASASASTSTSSSAQDGSASATSSASSSAKGASPTAHVSSVTGSLFVVTVLMLLFRKRYPRWWFDFHLELTRFGTRIGAYVLLLTDRYPSTVDAQAVHLDIDYPDVDRDLNRALPLIKWLLALPHYVCLIVLTIGALACTVIAWFSVLFTGRYPEALFDFVVGTMRWGLRVNAYAFILATDEYPPFRLR